MGQSRRQKPVRLASKLKEIRTNQGLTQVQMAKRLHAVKVDLQAGHVSEYESGKREPSLLVLLQYSRLADVPMEALVDDELELTEPVRRRKPKAALKRRGSKPERRRS